MESTLKKKQKKGELISFAVALRRIQLKAIMEASGLDPSEAYILQKRIDEKLRSEGMNPDEPASIKLTLEKMEGLPWDDLVFYERLTQSLNSSEIMMDLAFFVRTHATPELLTSYHAITRSFEEELWELICFFLRDTPTISLSECLWTDDAMEKLGLLLFESIIISDAYSLPKKPTGTSVELLFKTYRQFANTAMEADEVPMENILAELFSNIVIEIDLSTLEKPWVIVEAAKKAIERSMTKFLRRTTALNDIL